MWAAPMVNSPLYSAAESGLGDATCARRKALWGDMGSPRWRELHEGGYRCDDGHGCDSPRQELRHCRSSEWLAGSHGPLRAQETATPSIATAAPRTMRGTPMAREPQRSVRYRPAPGHGKPGDQQAESGPLVCEQSPFIGQCPARIRLLTIDRPPAGDAGAHAASLPWFRKSPERPRRQARCCAAGSGPAQPTCAPTLRARPARTPPDPGATGWPLDFQTSPTREGGLADRGSVAP